MRREHRKIERTPEQLAELKAVRERFQRDKPTRAQLEAHPNTSLSGPPPAKLLPELRWGST